ncbi:MAG: hypothetical protein O3C40_09720 [Planctomycetota bacterium]|nr:hypothetical protein [Planctomycetota bacterium]
MASIKINQVVDLHYKNIQFGCTTHKRVESLRHHWRYFGFVRKFSQDEVSRVAPQLTSRISVDVDFHVNRAAASFDYASHEINVGFPIVVDVNQSDDGKANDWCITNASDSRLSARCRVQSHYSRGDNEERGSFREDWNH